jgi:hypothetical protein
MSLLIVKLRLLPKIWLFALTAFVCAVPTTSAAQNLSNPMVGKTLTTVFTYPNFSDIAGLTLNGNAEKAGSVLLVGQPLLTRLGRLITRLRSTSAKALQPRLRLT